ncbi:MAG: glycerol-3-phosphate dehydrogenase/oxidase [Chloroflexi bacterium]|nr:glycerol-3-phosphate dehydrogenase/oxidase [Chloroflexota bacterium]
MSRQEVFNRFRENPEVSVLIVGAGINGIGVFREMALNGVDVLLVDRGDFCSGASAGSSHMAHGGIRYLENGEFRLVREALVERNRLLQNAPHAVEPLPTTIPIFHWLSGIFNAPLKFLRLRDKPSERGALVIKIGLILYDWFASPYRTMPTHRIVGRAKALARWPDLNPKVLFTATYYDAFMPYPERICVELVLDSEALSEQARAFNYVSLHSASGDVVTLRDELTGETVAVKPKVVVNAAGPWIDFANLAMKQQTRFIGGTKGSHLVLDHPALYAALDGHEMFFENKDGRITLICPYLGKVLAGTTDIRVDDPDLARCADDEVDYILDLIDVVFPAIKADRSHIVFAFTGVRPLPSSRASRTGAISRDHSVQVIEPGGGISFPIYALVGGKWTTFRAFAEQAADKVFARLGKPRKLSTDTLPIGGGKNYPATEAEQLAWLEGLKARTGLPLERLRALFDRYGTGVEAVADYIVAGQDKPLQSHPDYSSREVRFLVERERVVHLDDIVLRRSALAMLGFVNSALLEELAAIAAEVLGWSSEQADGEIRRVADMLVSDYRVPAGRFDSLAAKV